MIDTSIYFFIIFFFLYKYFRMQYLCVPKFHKPLRIINLKEKLAQFNPTLFFFTSTEYIYIFSLESITGFSRSWTPSQNISSVQSF